MWAMHPDLVDVAVLVPIVEQRNVGLPEVCFPSVKIVARAPVAPVLQWDQVRWVRLIVEIVALVLVGRVPRVCQVLSVHRMLI